MPHNGRRARPRWRTRVAAAALVAALLVGSAPIRGQTASLGEWSEVFAMPLVAVHAAWMSTGKVLLFDAWEIPGTPSARLWDPETNTYNHVPNGFAELFCAGHFLAQDGRLFTTGGHNFVGVGTTDATTFDPATELWTALPDLNYARWYPSLTQLHDGRLLTIGGAINRPNIAEVPEALVVGSGAWAGFQGAAKDLGEYPLLFQGPDGRVFVNGNAQSWLLALDQSSWAPLGQGPASLGTGVMYRPGHVLTTGGGSAPLGSDPVVTTTGVIDLNAPAPSWREVGSMQYGRSQHNLVILPDGTVLVVGGANEVSLVSNNGVLPAEIWDPDTERWTTVAAMSRPRMYHSTALLVPDGRVLAAGGGRISPDVPDELNGEFYSPPYLFRGARPTVSAAPSAVSYGDTFTVATPDPAGVARVTFVRASSVTHGINLDQRFFELPFTTTEAGVLAQAPSSPQLAPAGDYFLFTLNGDGVPSVGRVVRLTGATVTPTVSVNDVSANEGTTGARTLSFSVTLSSLTAETVSVDYQSADGTATAGSDYAAASDTLVFPPFTASRTVVVTTIPDDIVEENERFTVTLANSVHAGLDRATATGTIVNDDEAPPPTVSVDSVRVVEGSGGAPGVATFAVRLSRPSPQDVLVRFRTVADSASAPADFAQTSALLTLAGGRVVQTIQVPIVPDLLIEPDETFHVELFDVVNADLGVHRGTGTIVNDDNGIATTTFVITAGEDDANEDDAGVAVAGPTLWAGTGASPGAARLALRFAGFAVPADAQILAARIELTAASAQSASFQMEARAEAGLASAPFGRGPAPSQRALLPPHIVLTDSASWAAGATVALADITPVVQAVVEQPGWMSGLPLTVVMRGLGVPAAQVLVDSAESGSATAPRLVVTYMVGAPTPDAPSALASQVAGLDVAFTWQAPPPAGRPVVGYALEAGLAPGHTLATFPLGDVHHVSVRAPEGVFYVRVRAVTIAGTGPPSNEIVVATGTLAPPLAPAGVLATVQGTQVTLQWSHGPLGNIATAFQVQAGTGAGTTNVGAINLAGSARTFSAAVPPGTYFLRIIALNPAGASPPSTEVVVVPGPGTCTIPAAPSGVAVSASPGTIALSWAGPTAGAAPSGYLVYAGTASGAANLGVVTLPLQFGISRPVPPGPYFLRLAATNACGVSPLTAELSAVVP